MDKGDTKKDGASSSDKKGKGKSDNDKNSKGKGGDKEKEKEKNTPKDKAAGDKSGNTLNADALIALVQVCPRTSAFL